MALLEIQCTSIAKPQAQLLSYQKNKQQSSTLLHSSVNKINHGRVNSINVILHTWIFWDACNVIHRFDSINIWRTCKLMVCDTIFFPNSQESYLQWVNSVLPYVRKLHFMYEVVRTYSKCRWSIYRTSSKCRWSIYRTSSKRRGTLRVVHKVERSSTTVLSKQERNTPWLLTDLTDSASVELGTHTGVWVIPIGTIAAIFTMTYFHRRGHDNFNWKKAMCSETTTNHYNHKIAWNKNYYRADSRFMPSQ